MKKDMYGLSEKEYEDYKERKKKIFEWYKFLNAFLIKLDNYKI